jgi:SOS response regulatory protein OraA/RecX
VSDTLVDGDMGGDPGEDAAPADDKRRRTGSRSARSGSRSGGFGDSSGGERRRGQSSRGQSGLGQGGRSGRASGPQWSSRSTDSEGTDVPAEMEDPETVAKGICLRALTGTAKTRKQLADLLAKKDVPEEAAAAVLDRFAEVGLIDDAAFAAAWVSTRQSGRGLARRALASELRAKGVDGDVAAAAVAEVDPQDEWDSARRLVERKMPSMSRLDRVTAERRLMGMLARKGYGGGLAGHVVREALDAIGAAEDAAADEDDPTIDGGPAEDAPVWTAARSAARAAARAAAPDDLADAGVGIEVGEGQARPIGRLRPPPHVWVDDLP